MSEISEEKLHELKQIFEDCDKDSNGRIDWDEFCCMLDKLLGEKTLEEKTLAFDLIDTNHNGSICFDEFCEWWGGASNREKTMSENKQDLLDKKQELEERIDRIKKDISGGLHADFAEQATQLENRDVLLEILRVSEEELESTRKNLATLD